MPHPAIRDRTRLTLGLLSAAVCILPSAAAARTSAPSGHPAPVVLRAMTASAGQGPSPRAVPAGAPQGLTPVQIRSAYSLPTHGAKGQTIAVVSAFDDPAVEADLAAYDQRFGLPPCTAQNGCLRKLNESGRPAPLPFTDPTGMYITESALGTEVTHALCQSCRILLVEARDETEGHLAAAIQGAAAAGATVIITPYAAPEVISEPSFTETRAAIVTAAGDQGYSGAAQFPSALPNVVAVGGTQLRFDGRGAISGEQAWSQTTSGCSQVQQAPPWQASLAAAAGCGKGRAVADVAAVADPGAIVHVSGVSAPGGPWYVASGTSLSAPIIAAAIGLAGSAGQGEAKMLYGRLTSEPSAFRDIRTGADPPGCRSRICRAGPGWDGPTGVGTPDGLAGFLADGGVISRAHPRLALLAPRSGRVGPRGSVRLGLRNDNPFWIGGVLTLRRTLRVGRRLMTVVFGRASFTAGPLATARLGIGLTRSGRALLRSTGGLRLYARLQVRGAAGGSVRLVRSAGYLRAG